MVLLRRKWLEGLEVTLLSGADVAITMKDMSTRCSTRLHICKLCSVTQSVSCKELCTCVRACMRACVCVCVCSRLYLLLPSHQ